MTSRVKEFIEDYIEDIDAQRWEEVFEAWYDTTDGNDFWEDDENFKELLGVLDILNIEAETLSAARRAIIDKHTEDIVNTIQHTYYNRVDSWNLYWSEVLIKLRSTLGFSQCYIFAEIFNNVDLAGVTPDYSNQRFVIEGL